MKKGYWISLYFKVGNQDNLKRYAETVIESGAFDFPKGRSNSNTPIKAKLKSLYT